MTATNFITNPSFEVDTSGWTASDCTLSRDSVSAKGTGGYSAKCVASSSSTMSLQTTVSGLTVGSRYAVSFYVKTSTPLQFLATIGYDTKDLGRPILPMNSFQRRVLGFAANSESVTISLGTSDYGTAGDTFWLDCVMVTEGAVMPYFDGSYPYSSWSGTPHNSASTNSVFNPGECNTNEAVIVNGMNLSTYAVMAENKNGRYSLPVVRGDDITIPGRSGKKFVANKPIDVSQWTYNMLILGCNHDGSVPFDNRVAFEDNLADVLRSCISISGTVPIYAWQPDSSVRTANATLLTTSGIDPTMTMGGRRAELALVFDIMDGYWHEYSTQTIEGTPSASWSSQYLELTNLLGGEAPIEDSVVTVAGPITNPLIQDDTTGTWVQYTGTVAAGQSWIVDSGAFTSKIGTTSVVGSTSHHGSDRFLVIDSGTNTVPPKLLLTGTGTDTTTNISVSASRKFWTA